MNSQTFVSRSTVLKRLFSSKNTLVFLSLSFALLAFFAKVYPYFAFDLLITKTIQYYNLTWFDFLMKLISKSGQTSIGFIILVIISLILLFLRKNKESVMLIISTVGITLLGSILKSLVARPRPDPMLVTQFEHFTKLDSFPSGHVIFAVGFYGFLAFLAYTIIKKGLMQKIIIGFSTTMILLMGFSRIYLGVHWFSDVLGSYLVGSVWLLLMVYFYQKSVTT
ncbi:phosphatase PAP2 family protein [Candidatus Daviesbacteria bacterium]|nr:phosphatase PAP2 family protein [Candidatus Daviesbacteria bacterium]